MSKEEQTIVATLDQQYEGLLEDAKCLVQKYISASMALYKKTGTKTIVAAVSIKKTSPHASSIYWCKLIPLKGMHNKFLPLTIAKGNGKFKYPSSSFEFVKYPYQQLVLQVEEQLSVIRKVASENRQLRRTLVAYEKHVVHYRSIKYSDLYSIK